MMFLHKSSAQLPMHAENSINCYYLLMQFCTSHVRNCIFLNCALHLLRKNDVVLPPLDTITRKMHKTYGKTNEPMTNFNNGIDGSVWFQVLAKVMCFGRLLITEKKKKCGMQFVIYLSILIGNALMALLTTPMSIYFIIVRKSYFQLL